MYISMSKTSSFHLSASNTTLLLVSIFYAPLCIMCLVVKHFCGGAAMHIEGPLSFEVENGKESGVVCGRLPGRKKCQRVGNP